MRLADPRHRLLSEHSARLPLPDVRRALRSLTPFPSPRASFPRVADVITGDPSNNVTDHIFEKIGYNLHRRPDHPLGIIKAVIEEYFDEKFGKDSFTQFDDMYPIVSTYANFDSVLVPPDHVSRSSNDTYYVDSENVLRCHTSAHQLEMLKQGATKFLVTGDVYRRDSIDAHALPRVSPDGGRARVRAFRVGEKGVEAVDLARDELKETLEGLARHLLTLRCVGSMRTSPSPSPPWSSRSSSRGSGSRCSVAA